MQILPIGSGSGWRVRFWKAQLTYWKQQLAGAPPLLELPTDHPRPAVQTFRGAHQSLRLPKNVGDGLKALSRQEGLPCS